MKGIKRKYNREGNLKMWFANRFTLQYFGTWDEVISFLNLGTAPNSWALNNYSFKSWEVPLKSGDVPCFLSPVHPFLFSVTIFIFKVCFSSFLWLGLSIFRRARGGIEISIRNHPQTKQVGIFSISKYLFHHRFTSLIPATEIIFLWCCGIS